MYEPAFIPQQACAFRNLSGLNICGRNCGGAWKRALMNKFYSGSGTQVLVKRYASVIQHTQFSNSQNAVMRV